MVKSVINVVHKNAAVTNPTISFSEIKIKIICERILCTIYIDTIIKYYAIKTCIFLLTHTSNDS